MEKGNPEMRPLFPIMVTVVLVMTSGCFEMAQDDGGTNGLGPSDPRLYYDMDHDWTASGLVSDSSQNHLDATALGGARFDLEGIDGAAVYFDGSDDLVSAADHPALHAMSRGVTMAAWVKVIGYDRNMVMDKEESFEVMVDRGYVKYAFRAELHDWYWINSTVGVDQGEWVHIAVSYDGEVVNTYIDGTMMGAHEYPYGPLRSSEKPFSVGAGYKYIEIGQEGGWTWDYHFNGWIDEVLVYGLALGPGQVADLYQGADPASIIASS